MRIKWKSAALFLGIMVLISGCSNQKKENIRLAFNSENSNEEGTIMYADLQEKETEITVYTYSGDTFTANGKVELSEHGIKSQDAMLEIRSGEIIQSEETGKSAKSFQEAKPATITLYAPEGKVFGFYTTHEILVSQGELGNKLEIYGYLEGYYQD
jgi:hypothetical protein